MARGAKRTTSNRLDAATLYATAIFDKQDLLHSLDRRQFNNTVVQSLDNEDMTEPRPNSNSAAALALAC